MIFDIAMKLVRKALSPGFYNWVSYDLLGRRQGYERIQTYTDIYQHYREKGLTFQGKAIIEVGSGLQYFTALYFLADGATKVMLVEPKLRFSIDAFRKCLEEFNRHASIQIKESEVVGRIHCFPDLSLIPLTEEMRADLLCSYTVLEHVQNLPDFFSETARLLKPGGRAYHMIDMSDHTYQVFARLPGLSGLNSNRALFHLRYAPKTFKILNDPKCYMNRVLMPTYLSLAEKNGFRILSQATNPYSKNVKIHPALLEGKPFAPETMEVTTLALLLEQRGDAVSPAITKAT